MKKILIISGIILLLDQITKIVVTTFLDLYEKIIVIKDFFSIIYVRNEGAAFSMLEGKRVFFILSALIAVIIVYYFFIKDKELKNLEKVSVGILIGGIIGNLIDRVIFGYVIDFFSFRIFNYNFPIFNIADISIVIGALALIILVGGEKNDRKSNKKT